MVVSLLCLISAVPAVNHSVAPIAFEALPVHWLALQSDVGIHHVAHYTPSTKLLLEAVWVIVGLGLLISAIAASDGTVAFTAPEALMVQAFATHNSILATEQLVAS